MKIFSLAAIGDLVSFCLVGPGMSQTNILSRVTGEAKNRQPAIPCAAQNLAASDKPAGDKFKLTLRDGEEFVAGILSDYFYHTRQVGKRHVGECRGMGRHNAGLDEFLRFYAATFKKFPPRDPGL